jgi:thymidylate kinase
MYILFEGLDRCGKSTVVNYIIERLQNISIQPITLRTKELAGMYVPSLKGTVPNEVLYMLYWQAIRRADIEIVEPALKESKIVLEDRGSGSNIAYSYWKDIAPAFKEKVDNLYIDYCIKPDLILFFKSSYTTFLERKAEHRMIKEKDYNKVNNNYEIWIQKLLDRGYNIEIVNDFEKVEDKCVYSFNLVNQLLQLGV